MTTRVLRTLGVLLLVSVTACGQQKSVEDLASEAPADSSTLGTPPARPSSASASGAIRPDGRYASVDQLRTAVEQAGVKCTSWTPASTPQVTGARDEAQCGSSPGVLLVTFGTDNLAPSKVLMELQTRAKANVRQRGQAVVVVRGTEWAALTSRANAQQLNGGLGGELYDELASVEATEPPAN
ncbi:hypothetical protein [Yimella sp. cx-51]|uniref:hypothetical protein n=1 Tax=Yimella sp. cx-51 TaxID=2770551 RepID=UPI00165E2F05|nr:hypothetical protein [Yimella sp. cx-51]MBC9956607.1 hypothetical protein [Yimella sp. cx-51]QTH38294.1 hypothetical protein J5M86_00950 [Yimella sp. cx-51]